jgi:xylulokinase
MQEYLLGIDCGTTLCKCVLFDLEGNIVGLEKSEYGILQENADSAEQDPDWWWNAALTNVRQLIERKKVDARSIVGIGVDSQREAFVPLDAAGRKLMNSFTWLDRRVIPIAEEMKSILSEEEVRKKTGYKIDHIQSAGKILWIKKNKPEIFKGTKQIAFSKDYVVFRLTGKNATDYSMASRTMLFDIRKRMWDEGICKALGVPMCILPEVKGAWEVVGEVTEGASKMTGLARGTPVVSGGGDRPCEALGCGVITRGQLNIGTGTATEFEVPLSEPIIDIDGRVDCKCHVVPNTWEYETGMMSGAALRWFRDRFGYEEVVKAKEKGDDAYRYLDELAEKVSEGSDALFFYPYLMGAMAPKFNAMAKGVFFGFTLWHEKSHFIRSILEGLAFQYVEILETLNALGVKMEDVHMSGGETKSILWNQIKADVIGMPIRISGVADASAALGSAILAGIGSGVFKNAKDGVKKCVKFGEGYKFRTSSHNNYLRIYDKYKEVYKSIDQAYAATSSM